jgi:glycosyltransferase involved in cell wall biosynthesis
MRKFLYLSDSVYPDYDSAIEFIYLKSIRDFGYLPYVMFFSKEIEKTQIFEKHKAIIVLIPYFRIKYSVFSKLANYYRFFSCYYSLIRKEKFQFVQVRNNYIFAIISIFLRRFGKYKKIYQTTFPNLDAKLMKLKVSSSSLGYAFKKKIFTTLKRFIVNHSDYIITMSDKMTEVMKSKYKNPECFSLPMGVDEEFKYDEQKQAPVKSQFNLSDEKLILYFGNIRKSRKIEFIFQLAAKFAKDNKHKIKFLVLYKRAAEVEVYYKKMLNEMGLADIMIFKEEVPRDDVFYYINLAYLSLSPIPVNNIFIQSSPTKCIESIAYGCPVLATKIPDQITVVNNSGGGFICDYTVDAFYEKLIELLENPDLRAQAAAKGKGYVLSNRGYKVLTKKVAEFYDRI